MVESRERIPRHLRALLAANFVSVLGSGLTMPFLLIYLHQVRGISLGIAGLLIGGTESPSRRRSTTHDRCRWLPPQTSEGSSMVSGARGAYSHPHGLPARCFRVGIDASATVAQHVRAARSEMRGLLAARELS
ncbi:MAG: hypothetical protein WB770_05675 [Acidimicrobiales bacterium]